MTALLTGLEVGDTVYWTNKNSEVDLYTVTRIFADSKDEFFSDTQVWLEQDSHFTVKTTLQELILGYSKYKYTARSNGYYVERELGKNIFYWVDVNTGDEGENCKSEDAAWLAACTDNALHVFGEEAAG